MNPKNELQEYLAARGISVPEYSCLSTGAGWVSTVTLWNGKSFRGSPGRRKIDSDFDAARAALKHLLGKEKGEQFRKVPPGGYAISRRTYPKLRPGIPVDMSAIRQTASRADQTIVIIDLESFPKAVNIEFRHDVRPIGLYCGQSIVQWRVANYEVYQMNLPTERAGEIAIPILVGYFARETPSSIIVLTKSLFLSQLKNVVDKFGTPLTIFHDTNDPVIRKMII